MDYIGLLRKYKVNRPLTEDEIYRHLPQNKPSPSKPLYQSQSTRMTPVIRMNSTYLECADKFYFIKGFMSAFEIFLLGASLFIAYLGLFLIFEKQEYKYALFTLSFSVLSIYIGIKYFLLKECFSYTHYPIRFNRKTRKVHVFRHNGTVMTEDWEKLYFTLNKSITESTWEVIGHRMDEDGKTVLETFGFPYRESMERNQHLIWSFWEFVRRYMEEPEELTPLADQIRSVLDIADEKEGFLFGWYRAFFEPGPEAKYLFFIWGPYSFLIAIGRMIAIRTSKIPRWPAEIEAECQIESDDPNLRDSQHLSFRWELEN